MKEIIFDSSSAMWRPDAEANQYLITMTIKYIQDIMKYRNYIYLNRIYETFGVAWNPNEKNVCYRDWTKLSIDAERVGDFDFIIKISTVEKGVS